MKALGGTALRKKRLRKKATRAMAPSGLMDGLPGRHIRVLQKTMIALNKFLNYPAPKWEGEESNYITCIL